MTSMFVKGKKQFVLGDNIDYAEIYIDGDAGEVVDYDVNGTLYTETLDADGRHVFRVTCPSPNTTITITCNGDVVHLFVGGNP